MFPRASTKFVGLSESFVGRLKFDFWPLIFFTISGACIALFSGSDSSFDTLNYHLFNGWQTTRLYPSDFLPTSIWTFYPSHLDFVYFILWAYLPSFLTSSIVGAIQGLLPFFVYKIVRKFDSSDQQHSILGVFFGILCLASPLIRAQMGNSMHDTTLAILEIILIYQMAKFRLSRDITKVKNLAYLLGLILALKPAHIIFVVTVSIYLLYILRKEAKTQLTLLVKFSISFLLFVSPWLFLSVKNTGYLFFPYIPFVSSRDLLTNELPLYSYPDWKIEGIAEFLLHLIFPGGHPSINHEIPYIDFSVPLILFFAVFSSIIFVSNRSASLTITRQFLFGLELVSLGLLTYMLNQIIFTGIRYSLVSIPIALAGTALMLMSVDRNKKDLVFIPIFILGVLQLLPNQSLYLPTRNMPYSVQEIPNYGRTYQSYKTPIRNQFKKYNITREGDLVLLGQEQISFIGPLWDSQAKFIGLQAYILGKDSRKQILKELNSTVKRKNNIYLVTLSYNISTVSDQLAKVTNELEISRCTSVNNPFNREVSICNVVRKEVIN